MKKIMFNDKYNLTNQVLNGEKTMTRRFEKMDWKFVYHLDLGDNPRCGWSPKYNQDEGKFILYNEHGTRFESFRPKYQIGEIIAIAQNYYSIIGFKPTHKLFLEKGYKNKMFVKADLMPHQILITDIKLERLQDISDNDCINEGIIPQFRLQSMRTLFYYGDGKNEFYSPKEAFASLIDKISGKGYWESNPFVVVYSFKLVNYPRTKDSLASWAE